MKEVNWKKLGFDFLSIFIAVVSAFALNNWNENRRDHKAASKILTEISNGLQKDIDDIKVNKQGHKDGVAACQYWRKIIDGKTSKTDSLFIHYSNLTRDYISIQNTSGYQSLKSKGLELINDDSLRFEIITLYEYDYNILKKFEEEYHEMQYQENYFKDINEKIAPHFEFDKKGNIVGMELPLLLNKADKNILKSYLWKIEMNRRFLFRHYEQSEEKIAKLKGEIESYLQKKLTQSYSY